MDDEGRRGVGVNMRRGNARWEVGLEVFPKTVGFQAAGTEFSSVYCALVALLVPVNEV